MKSIPRYLTALHDLVFPHICSGCGSDRLPADQLLCWDCIRQLPKTGFEQHRDNLVERTLIGRLPFEMAFAHLFFGKDSLVQHLIHQVKYKGHRELGVLLGNMMGLAMQQAGIDAAIDCIVPLPLNKKKLLKRGYNQAELLAIGMGDVIGRPVETVAVIRTRFTETQTRKTREQRWRNVAEVFDVVNDHRLEHKHVLLVDDVVTTGATLEACGQMLLQIPGLRLSMATLAYASKI